MDTEKYLKKLFSEIIEANLLDESMLEITLNKAYISVLYSGRLICTLRESSRSVYCTFSSDFEELFDKSCVSRIPSDPKHIKVSLTCVYDLDLLRDSIGTILSSITTGSTFDICSHYMECSDAKQCVQTADYALQCSYRHKLKNGIVFYGKNRNVDKNEATIVDRSVSSKKSVDIGGKSLIIIPSDYVVIDTETTGFSLEDDHIIEVSILKCRSGVVIDRYSSLVKPPLNQNGEYVDGFISKFTGITNEMLATAPSPKNVFSKVFEMISDDIIVGHNVHFDIRFLSKAFNTIFGKTITNSYVDTYRLSRKLLPNLDSYKLANVASALGISVLQSHRALYDCEATQACLFALENIAVSQYGSVEAFAKESLKYKKLHSYNPIEKLNMADISVDESNILYDQDVVFTGALESMTRAEAMQKVINVGGRVANSITSKTDYLIVGSFDYAQSIKNGKSGKLKKAEEMLLAGHEIHILTESDFLSYFNDNDDTVVSSDSNDDSELPPELIVPDFLHRFKAAVLDEYENQIIPYLSKLWSSFGIDESEVLPVRHCKQYLTFTIVDKNGEEVPSGDFLRVKLGPRSSWFSIDMWSADPKFMYDPRFDSCLQKHKRHWVIQLDDLSDIMHYGDVIASAFKSIKYSHHL